VTSETPNASLPCRLLGRCPGCPLGELPYADGLGVKAQRLDSALRDFGLEAPVLPAKPAAPTLAYRLRAKLVVDGSALGLFERGSHRVVDVAGCLVLTPALTRASESIRRRLPLPIHGADLRETSEGVLVTLLSETPRARPELEAFRSAG
jgi:23S rRNA (uracil1939-C5)-methyltransferase